MIRLNEWEWFMAADIHGRWIVTQGKAYLRFINQDVEGELVYEDSQGDLISVFAKLHGRFFSESELTLEVTHQDAEPFSLSGHMYELATAAEAAFTVVLTDGTTVLGLASSAVTDGEGAEV